MEQKQSHKCLQGFVVYNYSRYLQQQQLYLISTWKRQRYHSVFKKIWWLEKTCLKLYGFLLLMPPRCFSFLFSGSHHNKVVLFRQPRVWIYGAPSKATLEARPRGFPSVSQQQALFPPNKAVLWYRSTKDPVLIHHSRSGLWKVHQGQTLKCCVRDKYH